jgi:hypothetical protein
LASSFGFPFSRLLRLSVVRGLLLSSAVLAMGSLTTLATRLTVSMASAETGAAFDLITGVLVTGSIFFLIPPEQEQCHWV